MRENGLCTMMIRYFASFEVQPQAQTVYWVTDVVFNTSWSRDVEVRVVCCSS